MSGADLAAIVRKAVMEGTRGLKVDGHLLNRVLREDIADAAALAVQQGHDAYVDPVNGGWVGYRAACWTCDWRGPLHPQTTWWPDAKNKARENARSHEAAPASLSSPAPKEEEA